MFLFFFFLQYIVYSFKKHHVFITLYQQKVETSKNWNNMRPKLVI